MALKTNQMQTNLPVYRSEHDRIFNNKKEDEKKTILYTWGLPGGDTVTIEVKNEK